MSKFKVSCIIPAYNEVKNIKRVLALLVNFPLLSEIIVVNDGSTDKTGEIVKNNFPQVRLIILPKNQGKADALIAGAKAAKHPVLFFCDADLINLKKTHLNSLIKPVLGKKVKMMVGAQEFMAPNRLSKKWRSKNKMNEFLKGLGGEKVLFKKDFLKIPNIENSDYGVEHKIINYFQKNKLPFDYLVLKGVTHLHKVEKWGIMEGAIRDLNSYFTFACQFLEKLGKKIKSFFESRLS
ncbi:glycosyltransferase family 2 protein [Candidatus Shapirobacteria bacterium]|nr:glycosyltransferase family 2 protein [Candidatus Shapirobacteria bacterium]